MSNLLPGERIDELQRNGLPHYPNPERFCFGMDAVHAVRLCPGKKTGTLSGSGLWKRDHSDPDGSKDRGKTFYGLEIHRRVRIWRNAAWRLNGLQDRIRHRRR